MKKIILSTLVLGFALTTSHLLAAPDLDAVKAQVEQVAKKVGADTATLEKAVPVVSAIRSDAGKTTVDKADNVLTLAAESAAVVAGKAGVYCSLANCPHAGSLADAKVALQELNVEVTAKDANKVALAAKLHHAAASILKATRTYTIHSDQPQKVRHSQVVKTADDIKLELASQLAEVTAKVSEVSGR